MTGPEWFNGGPGCTPPPPAGVPRPPARPGAPSLRGSCPDSPLDLGGKGEDLSLVFGLYLYENIGRFFKYWQRTLG